MEKQLKTDLYKVFVFDLDNVVYPEKDYLLQVYYLFAQFIEYTEQKPAGAIIDFMKSTYEASGSEHLFQRTQVEFNLDSKFEHNFKLLHRTARLPLKLLMFKSTLAYMQELLQKGKTIIVVAEKDPEMQLNKIRQIEWNGLENAIKIFFLEEISSVRNVAINTILKDLELNSKDVLLVDEKL